MTNLDLLILCCDSSTLVVLLRSRNHLELVGLCIPDCFVVIVDLIGLLVSWFLPLHIEGGFPRKSWCSRVVLIVIVSLIGYSTFDCW